MLFSIRRRGKTHDAHSRKLSQLQKELTLASEVIRDITSGEMRQDLEKIEFVEAKVLQQALLAMQDQLKQFIVKERQNGWVIAGLAKFGDIHRAHTQNLQELISETLKFIITHLKANQGGIFLLNEPSETERFLELKACYAYDRQKIAQKRIYLEGEYAEGLIGQAFTSGQITCLSPLPADYIRITSGLGEAVPSHLVIVPLKSADQKSGVIEIASLSPFTEYHLDFLEKVAQGFATALTVIKSTEITRQLLIDSQVQADMLRAQEEELRQNNEELLTTQEEMRRRGNELSSQIETINRSGIILVEFSPEGFIQQINEAFASFIEYDPSEILRHTHDLLKSKEELESKEYKLFQRHLREGVPQSGEYAFVTKSGALKWLKGAYSAVMNSHAKVSKVILIGFDITETKQQMEAINQQAMMLKTQEAILKKNNDALMQVRDQLQQKIEELNRFKAEEDKRLAEKEAKSQAWVVKMRERFKEQETVLKQEISQCKDYISNLEQQLAKYKPT